MKLLRIVYIHDEEFIFDERRPNIYSERSTGFYRNSKKTIWATIAPIKIGGRGDQTVLQTRVREGLKTQRSVVGRVGFITSKMPSKLGRGMFFSASQLKTAAGYTIVLSISRSAFLPR